MRPAPFLAAFALTCGAAAAAPAAATMVFSQSEAVSVYTSVATTVLFSPTPARAPSPFFAVADGLNAPKFAECYNGTGDLVWTFTNASGDFLVDSARHADGADNGPVDVFVASCDGAGCTLFGRTSATDTTRWEVTLPGCATDGGGGTYTGFQASDSGNRVAFMCRFDAGAGGPPTARVYLIGGQSGRVTWMHDLGAGVKAGQGQVQITATGSHVLFVNEDGVPTPNSAQAYVLDGTTGTLIQTIQIPFFITAAISDTGAFVAVGDDPAVHVWKADATGTSYAHAYDVTPPAAWGGSWIPWDMTISTGADAAELLVVGYISGDVLTVGVGAWALAAGGAPRIAWRSATNPSLQENPTLRADGDYAAVSLWGNDGDVPTVVLLRAGAADPVVFNYTTPGSMMAVDLNVVRGAAAGAPDVVFLAAAGKHVPANKMGNGGDAFGWRVDVPALA